MNEDERKWVEIKDRGPGSIERYLLNMFDKLYFEAISDMKADTSNFDPVNDKPAEPRCHKIELGLKSPE